MISDAAIIGADNCPPEISRLGDLPWNFVGEIGPMPRYGMIAVRCHKCNPSPLCRPPTDRDLMATRIVYLDLPCYLFVNDDLLEVRVWINQCERCGSVYWARQGPPYQRLGYRAAVGK